MVPRTTDGTTLEDFASIRGYGETVDDTFDRTTDPTTDRSAIAAAYSTGTDEID